MEPIEVTLWTVEGMIRSQFAEVRISVDELPTAIVYGSRVFFRISGHNYEEVPAHTVWNIPD